MSENFKVSEEFKEFMIALKKWVDDGCPAPTKDQLKEGLGFRKNDSICFQIGRWTEDDCTMMKVNDDLERLFDDQFDHSDYPFNKVQDGVSAEYEDEIDNESHYHNQARVGWINKTVASFEEENDE